MFHLLLLPGPLVCEARPPPSVSRLTAAVQVCLLFQLPLIQSIPPSLHPSSPPPSNRSRRSRYRWGVDVTCCHPHDVLDFLTEQFENCPIRSAVLGSQREKVPRHGGSRRRELRWPPDGDPHHRGRPAAEVEEVSKTYTAVALMSAARSPMYSFQRNTG